MISLIESVFDLASTIALEAGSLKEEAKTDPTNGRAATRIEVKRMTVIRVWKLFDRCVSKLRQNYGG